MNSLARVVAALERPAPDRVPYFECVIDQHVIDALRPGSDYFAFNDWLEIDNVGQNRSSWSRDNVEFIDEAKGLFRDKWGVIRAFGPSFAGSRGTSGDSTHRIRIISVRRSRDEEKCLDES